MNENDHNTGGCETFRLERERKQTSEYMIINISKEKKTHLDDFLQINKQNLYESKTKAQ